MYLGKFYETSKGLIFNWRKIRLSDGKEKGGITKEGVNSGMEEVGNKKEGGVGMHQGRRILEIREVSIWIIR